MRGVIDRHRVSPGVTTPSLYHPQQVVTVVTGHDDGREREVVELHRSLGLRAERVPLSGASRYQGNGADVDVYAFGPEEAPLVCEVKARAGGKGFVQLEHWLGEADALFLRRDRAEAVVVLPWRTRARLVKRGSP